MVSLLTSSSILSRPPTSLLPSLMPAPVSVIATVAVLMPPLPGGASTGRIELARAPSTPTLVLASIARAGTAGLMNVYRSSDGGISWKIVSQAPDYCGGQCFYNNFVAFHPSDSSIIFLGGV